jgi:hypothetical protein
MRDLSKTVSFTRATTRCSRSDATSTQHRQWLLECREGVVLWVAWECNNASNTTTRLQLHTRKWAIFGLLRSVGRRPSCDPRILLQYCTVSVLNEENWDACRVERFPLPLYGLAYRTSRPPPLTKISAMPQRKHCLGSATPQRNIVFLISPTRAHACLISCSGRKK